MKKPQPTRTLNPLPFQDLEPHRFEDLVRALAWDFRRWQSLEAIGRAGSDEGIDVRGVEVVGREPDEPGASIRDDQEYDNDEGHEDEHDSDGGQTAPPVFIREWIIQCKREKAFAPADVRKAVAESLDGKPTPHGFVLAVACDLSKKARDAFRAEMVKRGIQEFYTWARGELEDQLLQAKNDRVLFAFFGISLNTRRQGASSKLRSEITIKRRLRSAIIKDGETNLVLLRDPTDDRYPNDCDDARWLLCKFEDTIEPAGMRVLAREQIAWIRVAEGQWDTVDDYLPSRWLRLSEMGMRGHEGEPLALRNEREKFRVEPARDFWETYVPETERGFLNIVRLVPYDRVIAIDPVGDGYYTVPHVFVDWSREHGPFADTQWGWFTRSRGFGIDMRPDRKTRAKLFPVPIPPVYPPPAGFEYSPPPTQLAPDGMTALNAVMARASATLIEQPLGPERADDDALPPPTEFRTWRETVAGPVLAAIVEQLRGGGHEARLASRSVPTSDVTYGWEEELEFHVTLAARIHHYNPTYRPGGSLKFTADARNPLSFAVNPAPPEKERASQASPYARPVEPPPSPRPTLQDFTSERVAAEALAMIERLLEPRY